ncbi:hypothetical protein BOX15_Mlig002479g2 [Macrostomum lignano]|uniref:CUB domain-containing protein n=1 Tax=Macrostomum lignano TaxID=282301 RepID=A0A267DXC9_9PLAT|nr:hypothetical protein BOX15_Mlig002479g2 [Macrostomum lignano]
MKLFICVLVLACFAAFVSSTCPTLYKTRSYGNTRFFLNAASNGVCGGRYSNNLRCRYVLVNSTENRRGGSVNLNLRNFQTESCCDYLTINYTSTSYRSSGYRLRGYQSNNLRYTLNTAPRSEVSIYLYTDASVTRRAFFLTGSA